MSESPPPRPSFREALRFWSKLGWISFGGTAAHIAIMHDTLVDKKRWISNSRFLHALSHCMILPGPEAQQLAIYIGWKLHGKKGGLAAGSLFVLPSMFVILALSVLYVSFGNLPWIAAMFNGLKPAVIALVLLALVKIAARALRGPIHYVVAAAAFLGLLFEVSLPLLMLAAVLVGSLIGYLRPSLLHTQHDPETNEDESAFVINRHTTDPQPRTPIRSLLSLVAIACALWLIPLTLLYCFAPDFAFWRTLSLFFTKTAFVTLGGSYTVIPYVAQVTVTKLHWLSKLQMTDGFALAETTPGPLIIVVAFVGFMASYNHFHGSLWMGTLGLLATTFYTFLPCFLFVFAGAPLVERSQGNPAIEGILGLITAVVVGAILDLTVFLGKSVVFPTGSITLPGVDLLAVAWVLLSLLLLKRFKLNMIYLVLLSVVFGAARSLLPH
jgi:chromate transporter